MVKYQKVGTVKNQNYKIYNGEIFIFKIIEIWNGRI